MNRGDKIAVVASHLSPQGIADSSPNLSRICMNGKYNLRLIITHFFTFARIPMAMKNFDEILNRLSLSWPSRKIFAYQIVFTFIMVAIASEIGWQVT